MTDRVPLDLLARVLREELKRGCDDQAVTRGLDAFVTHWRQTALDLPRPLPLILQTEYHRLNPPARRRAIEEALTWIAKHDSSTPSPTKLERGQGVRPVSGRQGEAQTHNTQPPTPSSKGQAADPVLGRQEARPPSGQNRDQVPPSPIPSGKGARGSGPGGGEGGGRFGRGYGLPDLDQPVTTLRGINTAIAGKLRRLGIQTIGDLLFLFPNRHDDFSHRKSISELTVGAEETVIGTLWEVRNRPSARGRTVTEAILGDDTGNIRAVWFNQPYLARALTTDKQLVLSGKIGVFQGQKVLQSPEYEVLETDDLTHTGRLVPVYPLTEGLSQRTVRRLLKGLIDAWTPLVAEYLPADVRTRHGFMLFADALSQRHYPVTLAAFEAARRRLAFDELLVIHLSALRQKRLRQGAGPAAPLAWTEEDLAGFVSRLPFTLTGAQNRVLRQIFEDIARPEAMARLLQGEVGSGKTVVAAAALWIAARNGSQGALMAPTEILAEQHFRTLQRLLPDMPMALLTGSTPKREKVELYERIAEGEIAVIVGTHAIIQEEVEFRRLTFTVVDEQHRFGVRQRQALKAKGENPHLLVMTATPIPRTLALTLYGDLDLAVIDELPPGRKEILTKALKPNQRDKAYDFIRRQVGEGRQAFVICPLVEESDRIDARAAEAEHARLSQDVFPDLRLGLLHGRMRPAEKDDVMREFRDARLDILVSTAVVEVGIDVPNATVMLVEGADRFGLAQLHQFRGRVGRGEHQSYCLLLTETAAAETHERLAVIEKTQDGMELAEADLKLRGPGEFFGTRQSGLPDLRSATLADLDLFEAARHEAETILDEDPALSLPKHRLLAAQVELLGRDSGEVS